MDAGLVIVCGTAGGLAAAAAPRVIEGACEVLGRVYDGVMLVVDKVRRR